MAGVIGSVLALNVAVSVFCGCPAQAPDVIGSVLALNVAMSVFYVWLYRVSVSTECLRVSILWLAL